MARFTQRQSQVLALVAAGLQDKEIARKLGVAPGTVKAHLQSIYRILDVHNRTSALAAVSKNDSR